MLEGRKSQDNTNEHIYPDKNLLKLWIEDNVIIFRNQVQKTFFDLTQKLDSVGWIWSFAKYISVAEVSLILSDFTNLFLTNAQMRSGSIVYGRHDSHIVNQFMMQLKFDSEEDNLNPEIFDSADSCFLMLYATKERRAIFMLILVELLGFNLQCVEQLLAEGIVEFCEQVLIKEKVLTDKVVICIRIICNLSAHQKALYQLLQSPSLA